MPVEICGIKETTKGKEEAFILCLLMMCKVNLKECFVPERGRVKKRLILIFIIKILV